MPLFYFYLSTLTKLIKITHHLPAQLLTVLVKSAVGLAFGAGCRHLQSSTVGDVYSYRRQQPSPDRQFLSCRMPTVDWAKLVSSLVLRARGVFTPSLKTPSTTVTALLTITMPTVPALKLKY